ncbi:hypothetical protein ATCC90586_001855 [Pythium insidiosum]|nr:hypothetical protein ATCC90586_001855 [Pythium insidiosum]
MAPPKFIPRAPVTLPAFSCQTTFFALFMLLLEIGATAGLFVLHQLSKVHRVLYLTAAIIGVLSALTGLLALCRSTPAIITSYIAAVSVTFAYVVLGGISVVLVFDVRSAVASFLNKSLMPVSQAYNRKLLFDTKVYLIVAASGLLVSALAHAVFAKHLSSLLGLRRSAIAFLQTFSLIVFPFSLFLVLGAQYIVDTGTLASAPYTGIIVFGCGVVMLSVAVLAFIGASFEYRRLLSACCLLSYVAGTAFVGVSICYFALRKQIEENVMSHWETVRVVLPPTFQARYDRAQFLQLVTTNLRTTAYTGAIIGLFIFQEAGTCMTLMHQATAFKRQLAHDKQNVRELQTAADNVDSEASVGLKRADPIVLRRHQWSQYFEPSKRRQRVAMRVLAFLFVVGVALIFSVMCANVVFAAKCNSIGKLVQATNVTLFETGVDASGVSTISVRNEFTRGSLRVDAAMSVDPLGLIELEQYGNAERKKNDASFASAVSGDTARVVARPIDVTRFLWVDGSCQRSVMHVQLPTDQQRHLVIESNASVVVEGTPAASVLSLLGLDVTTDQANVNCSDVAVKDGGLSVVSNAGELSVRNVRVDASGPAAVDTTTRIFSALGPVTVENLNTQDCDVQIEAGAGTSSVTLVEATASVGRSRIKIKSTSGAVFASFVSANWVDLINTDGDVFADELRTTSNKAFAGRLQVTTVAGDITLRQLDPRGSVLVESSSGNIRVFLKTLAFAGMYSLRSDNGNVTVRKGFYSSDALTELPDLRDGGFLVKQGGINCNATTSRSCLSYGDMQLRTRLGDIEVILGCDTFQCG